LLILLSLQLGGSEEGERSLSINYPLHYSLTLLLSYFMTVLADLGVRQASKIMPKAVL